MNEFDEQTSRISKVLHDTASELDVPSIGVSAVRRHGSTRQHRRRAGIATVSAVALLGAGALTVQRLSHNPSPSTGPAATANDSEPTSTQIGTFSTAAPRDPGSSGEPVQRVDSAFVWNAVEPGSAEAVTNLVWGIGPTQEAPYFAWSTAPGPIVEGEFRPVLYRSDDGIRWAPAANDTFTEPQVSKRGLASQNGVLFAFGTAAATAAIPQGGAGDAVVDVSSDGGASWQTQVLPLDLRGLAAMKGVGGVGMSGAMAAANGVVVAVAQPNVWWDASGFGRQLVMTANGAYEITQPGCDGPDCNPPTTTVVNGPSANTSSDTAPADTSPAVAPPSGSAPQMVEDTVPTVSGLIPFDELGIDPASVAAARTPRVFVSTNGADFAEAAFPALPDFASANGGDVRVFTAGGAFYVTVSISTFDPTLSGGGYASSALIYRSTDGITWEDVATVSDRELLGVMDDGTLVARGYTDTSTNVATSTDGETWQVHDLRPLIDPSDGQIVNVDLWSVSVDEQGITAVGAMTNDPIAEAGGRSLERGGVRLELASSRSGSPRAFDVATGDEMTKMRWDDLGGLSVLDADGAVRATFTSVEQALLQGDMRGQTMTRVLLHSDDGVNWSRENLADLTGSQDAGPGFIRSQDGKVLVTVIDPTKRTNTVATTTVLVGTRK